MQTREKYAWLMRERGTPLTIDARPTILHIKNLHDRHGMSYTYIGDQAAVGKDRIAVLGRSETGRIDRRRAARIALVTPTVPVGAGALREWGGARMDPSGAIRRLNAMSFDGWTLDHLSRLYGGDKSTVRYLLMNKRRRVMGTTHHKIKELYSDLEGVNPKTAGIDPQMQQRARRAALVRGGAPRKCWDDDTIDVPDAIAEWTGECGSVEGYWIHKREKDLFWKWTNAARTTGKWVLGCPPCREVRSETHHPK